MFWEEAPDTFTVPSLLSGFPCCCQLIHKHYFRNECQGFRFPNARKHLRPSGFIVFERLETLWNPKHEFLKWLLQRNNTKLCSVVFFPFFFKMTCMCDLLYSVGIHCICVAFVFINYPILGFASHRQICIQKRYELDSWLEVIYILFLSWPKEGFASRKQSRKKNFA